GRPVGEVRFADRDHFLFFGPIRGGPKMLSSTPRTSASSPGSSGGQTMGGDGAHRVELGAQGDADAGHEITIPGHAESAATAIS
ncbi:MAG TPA: hypothetical protein PLU22_24785, partial [Polyangiaceae bacterium]|nr:hypothetical protein [Polyangiaceae bacterium]